MRGTDAPVPMRFLFLQIGPDDKSIDYHEVGRAMATLMSDAVSHMISRWEGPIFKKFPSD